MELKLRNFESLTILHIHKQVEVQDIPRLRVGIPSIKIDQLPLLLDFEHCQFAPKQIIELSRLLTQLKTEIEDLYWVSKKLDGAIAHTLTKAMKQSKNADRYSIANVYEYELRLQELEAEAEAMEERLAQFDSPESPYQEMVLRIERMEWMKDIYEKSIKHDKGMNELFQQKWQKETIDQSELKALRKKILGFMQEQGVQL